MSSCLFRPPLIVVFLAMAILIVWLPSGPFGVHAGSSSTWECYNKEYKDDVSIDDDYNRVISIGCTYRGRVLLRNDIYTSVNFTQNLFLNSVKFKGMTRDDFDGGTTAIAPIDFIGNTFRGTNDAIFWDAEWFFKDVVFTIADNRFDMSTAGDQARVIPINMNSPLRQSKVWIRNNTFILNRTMGGGFYGIYLQAYLDRFSALVISDNQMVFPSKSKSTCNADTWTFIFIDRRDVDELSVWDDRTTSGAGTGIVVIRDNAFTVERTECANAEVAFDGGEGFILIKKLYISRLHIVDNVIRATMIKVAAKALRFMDFRPSVTTATIPQLQGLLNTASQNVQLKSNIGKIFTPDLLDVQRYPIVGCNVSGNTIIMTGAGELLGITLDALNVYEPTTTTGTTVSPYSPKWTPFPFFFSKNNIQLENNNGGVTNAFAMAQQNRLGLVQFLFQDCLFRVHSSRCASSDRQPAAVFFDGGEPTNITAAYSVSMIRTSILHLHAPTGAGTACAGSDQAVSALWVRARLPRFFYDGGGDSIIVAQGNFVARAAGIRLSFHLSGSFTVQNIQLMNVSSANDRAVGIHFDSTDKQFLEANFIVKSIPSVVLNGFETADFFSFDGSAIWTAFPSKQSNLTFEDISVRSTLMFQRNAVMICPLAPKTANTFAVMTMTRALSGIIRFSRCRFTSEVSDAARYISSSSSAPAAVVLPVTASLSWCSNHIHAFFYTNSAIGEGTVLFEDDSFDYDWGVTRVVFASFVASDTVKSGLSLQRIAMRGPSRLLQGFPGASPDDVSRRMNDSVSFDLVARTFGFYPPLAATFVSVGKVSALTLSIQDVTIPHLLSNASNGIMLTFMPNSPIASTVSIARATLGVTTYDAQGCSVTTAALQMLDLSNGRVTLSLSDATFVVRLISDPCPLLASTAASTAAGVYIDSPKTFVGSVVNSEADIDGVAISAAVYVTDGTFPSTSSLSLINVSTRVRSSYGSPGLWQQQLVSSPSSATASGSLKCQYAAMVLVDNRVDGNITVDIGPRTLVRLSDASISAIILLLAVDTGDRAPNTATPRRGNVTLTIWGTSTSPDGPAIAGVPQPQIAISALPVVYTEGASTNDVFYGASLIGSAVANLRSLTAVIRTGQGILIDGGYGRAYGVLSRSTVDFATVIIERSDMEIMSANEAASLASIVGGGQTFQGLGFSAVVTVDSSRLVITGYALETHVEIPYPNEDYSTARSWNSVALVGLAMLRTASISVVRSRIFVAARSDRYMSLFPAAWLTENVSIVMRRNPSIIVSNAPTCVDTMATSYARFFRIQGDLNARGTIDIRSNEQIVFVGTSAPSTSTTNLVSDSISPSIMTSPSTAWMVPTFAAATDGSSGGSQRPALPASLMAAARLSQPLRRIATAANIMATTGTSHRGDVLLAQNYSVRCASSVTRYVTASLLVIGDTSTNWERLSVFIVNNTIDIAAAATSLFTTSGKALPSVFLESNTWRIRTSRMAIVASPPGNELGHVTMTVINNRFIDATWDSTTSTRIAPRGLDDAATGISYMPTPWIRAASNTDPATVPTAYLDANTNAPTWGRLRFALSFNSFEFWPNAFSKPLTSSVNMVLFGVTNFDAMETRVHCNVQAYYPTTASSSSSNNPPLVAEIMSTKDFYAQPASAAPSSSFFSSIPCNGSTGSASFASDLLSRIRVWNRTSSEVPSTCQTGIGICNLALTLVPTTTTVPRTTTTTTPTPATAGGGSNGYWVDRQGNRINPPATAGTGKWKDCPKVIPTPGTTGANCGSCSWGQNANVWPCSGFDGCYCGDTEPPSVPPFFYCSQLRGVPAKVANGEVQDAKCQACALGLNVINWPCTPSSSGLCDCITTITAIERRDAVWIPATTTGTPYPAGGSSGGLAGGGGGLVGGGSAVPANANAEDTASAPAIVNAPSTTTLSSSSTSSSQSATGMCSSVSSSEVQPPPCLCRSPPGTQSGNLIAYPSAGSSAAALPLVDVSSLSTRCDILFTMPPPPAPLPLVSAVLTTTTTPTTTMTTTTTTSTTSSTTSTTSSTMAVVETTADGTTTIPPVPSTEELTQETSGLPPPAATTSESVGVALSTKDAATNRPTALNTTRATSTRVITTPRPPTTTQAPTTTEVPPAPRVVGNEQAMAAVMSADDAASVTAATSSAVALGGAVNPAAANKGANIANILSVIDCRFDPDSVTPSLAEVIVRVSVTRSPMRFMIGGIMTSCIFVWGFFILQFVASKVLKEWLYLRTVLAMLSAMLMGFLIPTAVGFCTTVGSHAVERTDQAAAVIGGILLVGSIFIPFYFVMTRLPPNKHVDDFKRVFKGTIYFGWIMLAEGIKDTTQVRYRLAFFEDITAAILIAVIAGIQPDSGSCYTVAGAMLLVAVLHLAYVVIVRPSEEPVENVFAIIVAIGQVVASALTIVAMSNTVVLTYIGYVALAQSGVFMLQTLYTIGTMIYEFLAFKFGWKGFPWRRPRFGGGRKDADKAASVGDNGGGGAATSLLLMPDMGDVCDVDALHKEAEAVAEDAKGHIVRPPPPSNPLVNPLSNPLAGGGSVSAPPARVGTGSSAASGSSVAAPSSKPTAAAGETTAISSTGPIKPPVKGPLFSKQHPLHTEML